MPDNVPRYFLMFAKLSEILTLTFGRNRIAFNASSTVIGVATDTGDGLEEKGDSKGTELEFIMDNRSTANGHP
jgi:hypothetical protein